MNSPSTSCSCSVNDGIFQLEAKGIDLNNLTEQDEVNMGLILCFKDLLSFAWQISVGLVSSVSTAHPPLLRQASFTGVP